MTGQTWLSYRMRLTTNQSRRRLILLIGAVAILYVLLITSPRLGTSQVSLDEREIIPSCGDVCDIRSHRGPGVVRKNFKCHDIIIRMSTNATGRAIINPAPKEPPIDLYEAFTMYGDMPIQQNYYFSEIYGSTPIQIIDKTSMANLAAKLGKGETIGTYGLAVDEFVQRIVVNMTRPLDTGVPAILDGEGGPVNVDAGDNNPAILRRLNGTRGFVIGSQKLWIEAILLAHGVTHVTTLEYATMVSNDERVAVVKPSELATHLLELMPPVEESRIKWPAVLWTRNLDYFTDNRVQKERNVNWEPFDFGFTFSSLEHAGLGRYGDPLDPFGDLEAMAQAWCMTRPGGLFFMGLPVDLTRSYLVWNAHRIYGPNRVAQMAANWDIVAVLRNPELPTNYHINTIYVLRRPL